MGLQSGLLQGLAELHNPFPTCSILRCTVYHGICRQPLRQTMYKAPSPHYVM